MMKIYNWKNLSVNEQKNILQRPALENKQELIKQVQDIINQVRSEGDKALVKLTKKYDGVKFDKLDVSHDEVMQALNQVSDTAKQAIEFAKKMIEKNHFVQLTPSQAVTTCAGVTCERQARPIERVGLYIPGGSAPLISTVLMLAIPAKIANCAVRIICTPANAEGQIDPHILYAANLAGIEKIYKVGGAQAIAAMAYGTETIAKVDKIFGPGNAWVTQAKTQVAQDVSGVSIDMPAGPSEIMVIADDNANPDYVAADLLSQAEHGIDSQVMLVTLTESFAKQVVSAIKQQMASLSRLNVIEQSLQQSRIIIVSDMKQAIVLSNRYAPEHLILQVTEPAQYIDEIQNAGAVFLGQWAAETLGDYVTGSNHVLPTYGYAKNHSGISVHDFMKFINFQSVTRSGLEKIGPYAEKLAELEGLDAHQQAVSIRLRGL